MKKTFKSLLLMVGMALCGMISYAQDPNFYIYLCLGQSNMEGNASGTRSFVP